MNAQEEGRAEFVDFEDQDLAFDRELEKVGAVVKELKRPVKKRVFSVGWTRRRRSGRRSRIPSTRPSS